MSEPWLCLADRVHPAADGTSRTPRSPAGTASQEDEYIEALAASSIRTYGGGNHKRLTPLRSVRRVRNWWLRVSLISRFAPGYNVGLLVVLPDNRVAGLENLVPGPDNSGPGHEPLEDLILLFVLEPELNFAK